MIEYEKYKKDYNEKYYNIFTDGGYKVLDNGEKIAASAIYCIKENKRRGKIIEDKCSKSSFSAEALAIIGAI